MDEIEAIWAAVIAIVLKLDQRHRYFLSDVLDLLGDLATNQKHPKEVREIFAKAFAALEPLGRER